ncbi:uncharacterized protein [Epargyreus clarus]|uniref:uncharacterized protein n=1 Tax=Epargyreus clarus TaxID=520877 RepID=UPI003C2D82B4
MDEKKFAIALTVLLFWTTTVYGDDDDEAIMACVELMKPAYADEMCCESMKSIDKFDDDMKECKTKGSSEGSTCADFECFLNKQGIMDGSKIIDDKAKSFLDGIAKEYPKEKNIIEVLKDECLDGQYDQYPPEDGCIALKFYVCIYTNVMVECNSWKDTKVCKEAADFAKKCKEAK